MSLPNLSGLSLHCAPCGATFERSFIPAATDIPVDRWEDVSGKEVVQQHPRRKEILATHTCLVCLGDIDRNALLGDGTRDLEVLVELACGHAFHRTCLAGIVSTGQAKCPGPDRDFIPQSIIDRLGGTAKSGEEAPLGPAGNDPFYDNSQPTTDQDLYGELPTLDALEVEEAEEDDTGGETADEEGDNLFGYEDGSNFNGFAGASRTKHT